MNKEHNFENEIMCTKDCKICLKKRNRHLVDNSSVCICYLTENKGGTFYTVNYANSKQLKIVNIAELI